MYRDKERFGQNPMIVTRSKTKFNEPLKWAQPAMVFTCSWSDWFIEQADAWRDEAWSIIKRTPHLTYQILTKRPERIAEHLPSDWGKGYDNVWLGVSAENQEYADYRIPELLGIPAKVRFVSAEPLLSPITFRWAMWEPWKATVNNHLDGLRRVDWVIVGGESGPERRPFQKVWAEEIRDQCKEAGVAFYMKQMGGLTPKEGAAAIPPELMIQEFPN